MSKKADLPASKRFSINIILVINECVASTQCNIIFSILPNFVQEIRPLVKNQAIDLNCNSFSLSLSPMSRPKSNVEAGCELKK